jgi:Cu(I)/Ag(I) efflux system protein CusF
VIATELKWSQTMKSAFQVAFVGAMLVLPSLALAQEPPMVKGTVDKVDAGTGKISLTHEAIPNLGMDPMSMVFKAGDPSMLKAVKAGDKVQFEADRVNGQLTVVKIQKTKK